MKQKRKRRKLNKDTKKYIITALIFIFIIIILGLLLNYLENKSSNNTNNSEYSSIKEIVEKYGCKYIKENKSKEDDFALDIYLKFKYNTFEGNESKQRFYENVIGILTNFINNNFRLIDEERNLVISVTKNNVSDNSVYSYLVNGVDNYFNKNESKILLNSKNEKDTNISIDSKILNNLIQNNWSKDVINLENKNSTFDGYDIYFDEGIEVKIISKKIHNIVFTTKFTNPVINGIIPGTDFKRIISILGEPIYGIEDGQYIGYKNENMYVFFTNESICIYRNEIVEMKEFEILLNKYIAKEIELKEFMNELTYLWDDYDEYRYNSNFIYINYPLKGIKIEMDYENSLGILIYNNCNVTEGIKELIENGKITGALKENLVDISFLNRINKLDEYKYVSTLNVNENGTLDSNLYYSVIQDSKVLFISKNSEIANKELNENIFTRIFYTR